MLAGVVKWSDHNFQFTDSGGEADMFWHKAKIEEMTDKQSEGHLLLLDTKQGLQLENILIRQHP